MEAVWIGMNIVNGSKYAPLGSTGNVTNAWDPKVVSNHDDMFMTKEEVCYALLFVVVSVGCITWSIYKARKLNSQAALMEKRYQMQRETGIFTALEVRPSEDNVFSVSSLIDITTNLMIPPLMRPKHKHRRRKKKKHIRLPPIPQNNPKQTSKSDESNESKSVESNESRISNEETKTKAEPKPKPKAKTLLSSGSTETAVEVDDTTTAPTELTPTRSY
uniref:Uncharacterized protein n=1 Tax=Panagrellus redivivus TaxID=6233 RepID=A0A7E4ZUL2_PANRE